MEFLIGLIVAAGLGFIPAEIAKKKGRTNYWLWWFYGWMLFIVALIHSLCMDDLNASESTPEKHKSAYIGSADELKKYKDLLDCGVITQEEFDAKKKQLLGL